MSRTVTDPSEICNHGTRDTQIATAIAVAQKSLHASQELQKAALALLEAAQTQTGHSSDRWRRVAKHLAGVIPAREANSACASGAIRGAVKRGKYWVARESAIDAWIESARTETSPANDGAEGLAASWERRARRAGGGR